MYSIYKMLPNDTDLTVFREDGDIDGYNFAFIGDHFDYHTEQDSYERMDLNTFNHQASYLTATLDYFSNNSLENLKSQKDDVYFNFPYFGLVFYPFSWVLPMFIICVILFFMLLIVGISKKKLTVKGILKGFVPFTLSLVIAPLITFFSWKLLLKIHPQYQDILHGFTYNGYYYIAAFIALTLALCFWFYKGFFKKRTALDLLIAPLFFWFIINGSIAFYLQGSAFFILPVIISLVMLSVFLFSDIKTKTLLFFSILSIPVLFIFAPFLKMFPVGLGLKMLAISAIFTVLLFGFLVPIFQQYKNPENLAKLFLLIGVLGLITASFYASYSIDRKQPNSILYVLDANKNEAYWASYNLKVDEFTKQFLGENPTKGSFDKNTTASKYKTEIQLYTKTEVLNIEKPIITIVSDTVINSNRKVCLSIFSTRNANKIELLTNIPINFKSFKVNEEAVSNKSAHEYVYSIDKGTIMSYYRTKEDEIIDLEFVVDQHQKIDIDIIEAKWDLFTNPVFHSKPRSEIMIPMPFVLNDATVIKTNIKL